MKVLQSLRMMGLQNQMCPLHLSPNDAFQTVTYLEKWNQRRNQFLSCTVSQCSWLIYSPVRNGAWRSREAKWDTCIGRSYLSGVLKCRILTSDTAKSTTSKNMLSCSIPGLCLSCLLELSVILVCVCPCVLLTTLALHLPTGETGWARWSRWHQVWPVLQPWSVCLCVAG